MRVRVGTSGYSYPEWKPSFYPAELKPAEMLRYYGARLPTVEINNTFYRMPRSALLARWAAEVPPGFAFGIKAPQRITHQLRLAQADEPTRILFDTVATLGDLRGPVLFQLPPSLKLDLERLRGFLALLPPGHRAAFEFRHESWLTDEVYAALHAHDATLCIAEDEERATPLVATSRMGYLRLREIDYDDAALARWRDRIRAQPWDEVYVYFKHEEGGVGPRLAARLMALVAEPLARRA